jgi:hypothetical protein
MSTDTIDEIAANLVKLANGSARLVEQSVAVNLLEQLAAAHVEDSQALHWWASLRLSASIVDYGDDSSVWASTLESVLNGLAGDEVYLAVTDDEFGPWPILAVEKNQLVRLLGELSFFEYFVFQKDGRQVMFDTHHNRLVVSAATR